MATLEFRANPLNKMDADFRPVQHPWYQGLSAGGAGMLPRLAAVAAAPSKLRCGAGFQVSGPPVSAQRSGGGCFGRVKLKRLPAPGSLSTPTLPPCFSTMDFTV